MSTQQMPPYQPPPEPNISARTLVTVIAVVFVVIVAVALAMILMAGGGGSGSPSAAVKGFWDGFDDGNMKAAFDHTIMKFMPGYDAMVSQFENYSYGNMMDLKISDISVTYNSSMTPDQRNEALDDLSGMLMGLDISVDDMAWVSFSMKVSSSMYPGGAVTIPYEMLCAEVDGDWYVATISMPDMFS